MNVTRRKRPLKKSKNNLNSHNKKRPGYCEECNQNLSKVIYRKHPFKAEPEMITMTYKSLKEVTNESNSEGNDKEDIPMCRITDFNVYDKFGHLCALDSGLIESGTDLMVSGYVKDISEEDPTIGHGIPTYCIGPLQQWFIAGFDGGNNYLLGISTEQAHYYLLEPALEYKPFMTTLQEKCYLTKIVIEFLLETVWDSPCYEDLLQLFEDHGHPGVTEEILMNHAQFVCNQVMSFDAAGSSIDDILMATPCMRSLAEKAHVDLTDMQQVREFEKRVEVTNSKAVGTDLVRAVFEPIFKNQMKQNQNNNNQECGICDSCQSPDCGTCSECRKLSKLAGAGSSKTKCKMRKCCNSSSNDMKIKYKVRSSVKEMDNERSNKIESSKKNNQKCGKCDSCLAPDCGTCSVCRNLRRYNGAGPSNQTCAMRKCQNLLSEDKYTKKIAKNYTRVVQFTGKVITNDHGRAYYNEALVDDIKVKPLDFVILNFAKRNEPLLVKIVYMWEENEQQMLHASLFCKSKDTILGDTSNPQEIFMLDECEELPLNSIVSKLKVVQKKFPKNWYFRGGKDKLEPQLKDNGVDFFYSKIYNSESSRFETIIEDKNAFQRTSCFSCSNRANKAALEVPVFKNDTVFWLGEEYKIGTGVFFEPYTIVYRSYRRRINDEFIEKDKVNNKMYPEHFRKSTEFERYGNLQAPSPFNIGLIIKIHIDDQQEIKITVRAFYRPEDTPSGPFIAYKKDLNFLYWSNDVYTVNFKEVRGKCYLAYHKSSTSAREWSKQGPYRFYYNEVYNKESRTFSTYQGGELSEAGSTEHKEIENTEKIPSWEITAKPLACMDLFSGCGGLSDGLRASGVAEIKWAIDNQPTAAHTFKLNHTECTVYTADCNEILENIMEDKKFNNRKLPKKGEVQMIVGGLPCQGYSTMNRFASHQESCHLNSLIVPFLSYCDYFRPQYVVMENVRNFVTYKHSIVFKHTLCCLLAIGYQVTYGILQSGNYGVSQDRRRLIIIAAAPDCVLPTYPEPQNTFVRANEGRLALIVENIKYYTGTKWCTSAPYRALTVRDAIADLPDIESGGDDREFEYEEPPVSHFQRLMRPLNYPTVKNHVTKTLAPLVDARIAHIPPSPRSDWRDLPNIIVELRNGRSTDLLKYSYRSQKRDFRSPRRGVCVCSTGAECNPADRQANTLIPWSLPHTADRHNNWVGIYGRLDWNGYFCTTVTNPEPMGKQGRVLHPDQSRIISIRECARSQGFSDEYLLYGKISDKYRQVGNAVPPPLALELGKQLQKAIVRGSTILSK